MRETAMPDMRRLWHYTANTGDIAETGRDECHQAAIDLLMPIVDAQEGDLPELGLGIDIMTPRDAQRPRLPGAAFFQIGPAGERMSKSPYVMGVACWRAHREADAWAKFREIAKIGAAAWPNRPTTLTEPPDIPWLAVNILPHAMRLPPETKPVLGDLGRCLAWALIESE
jgi:hypothetical protein